MIVTSTQSRTVGRSGLREGDSAGDKAMPYRSSGGQESWRKKFYHAFRGFKRGVRGESSFFVHFFFAAAVIAAGLAFGVSMIEWCIRTLCIAIVLAAEMFNSALERMARSITDEYDSNIGAALDIGSAAVLITAIGAALVGATIFISRLIELLGW